RRLGLDLVGCNWRALDSDRNIRGPLTRTVVLAPTHVFWHLRDAERVVLVLWEPGFILPINMVRIVSVGVPILTRFLSQGEFLMSNLLRARILSFAETLTWEQCIIVNIRSSLHIFVCFIHCP